MNWILDFRKKEFPEIIFKNFDFVILKLYNLDRVMIFKKKYYL